MENLEQAIAQRIRQSEQQRITFAEFMEMVLYHPQFGYYATPGSIIGAQGDFVTSPHMGSDFGELIAEQFADMWEVLGQPDEFTVMEMGAGQGLVAGDVIAYLKSHHPNCLKALNYIIVEKSPALRVEQKKRLAQWQQQGVSIRWQTLQDIESDTIVGCAFSNELVDAFPVHWIQLLNQKLVEKWVTLKGKQFVSIPGPLSTPKIEQHLDWVGIDLDLAFGYPEEYLTEVNLAAVSWIDQVADKIHKGYILTIDYGYTAQKYYSPARCEGTLQCYYQHSYHNDPLIHVGDQDITAHVNFTALEQRGEEIALKKIGFVQQGLFLMALGLSDRLTALSQSTLQFTKLATAQNIQNIMMRREALHQLISPMGLGNFGVLIQGKNLTQVEIARPLKGLTIPPMV